MAHTVVYWIGLAAFGTGILQFAAGIVMGEGRVAARDGWAAPLPLSRCRGRAGDAARKESRRMNRVSPASPELSPVLWWTREFPGSKEQVRQARRWLEELLPGCEQLKELTLLVSELVTNAIVHARTTATVNVRRAAGALRIAVSDDSAAPPTLDLHPELAAEGGRGLLIVSMLATRWGVERGSAGGKAVWFELDT
jgi:anti-sigma regulatory factor (Ser/Thr protein kinase)